MLYEFRVYQVNDGGLDRMMKFFELTNLKYFEKHGFDVEGMWLPAGDESQWYYLLRFVDEADGEAKWNAMHSDPGWLAEMTEAKLAEIMGNEGVTSYLMTEAPFFTAPR